MPIADEWRALAARARAQRVLRAGLRAARPRRCSGAMPAPALVWSRTAQPRLLGLLSGAHRTPALRRAAAGADRLDASLCAARHAARRSREAEPSSPRGSITSPTIRNCRSSCCCPTFRWTGGFARTLDAVLDAARRRTPLVRDATRARCCRPAATRDGYLDRAVGAQEAQGAAPPAQAAGRPGPVMSASTSEPAAVAACARRFLRARSRRLEGPRRHRRAQTMRRSATFLQTAVSGLASEGKARIAPAAARRPRRSPPSSRCGAAQPPGAGRSPMTRASRAFRRACSCCST